VKIKDSSHPQVKFTQRILGELDALPTHIWAAFGASCSERLLPVYEAFSLDESWGDPTVLRDAIDGLWEIAMGRGGKQTPGAEFQGRLIDLGPRSEDHTSLLVPGAQYSVSCIVHAYRSVTDNKADEAAWCSIVTRDCVSEYLDWVCGPLDGPVDDGFRFPQTDWYSHPLMQMELDRQIRDLAALLDAGSVDSKLKAYLAQPAAGRIDPIARRLV
jgi:hypothetical protein